MAMKNKKNGFALLVAVIFMSVMLALGLALASLGYKQEVLASSAIESQYAFYAADAALECALYADQRQNLFVYVDDLFAPAPAMTCDGGAPIFVMTVSHTASVWETTTRLSLDADTRCADVTIYKYKTPLNGISSYLFSQGYDTPCSNITGSPNDRFISRGLSARY